MSLTDDLMVALLIEHALLIAWLVYAVQSTATQILLALHTEIGPQWAVVPAEHHLGGRPSCGHGERIHAMHSTGATACEACHAAATA